MENLIKYIAEGIPAGMGSGDKKVDKDTEAKLAQSIAKVCCKENFRSGEGYIMGYDERAYTLLTDKQLESLLVAAMEEREVGGVYVINSISQIRKHLERRITRPYNPKKNIISFENAVLDMDTGHTCEHSPELETNLRMNYAYDPLAKCPKFMKYLGEVLKDADTISTLQEFCGALFIDRRQYKIENILYLLGGGQNGKGVFTGILTHMLGPQNITSFSVERLTRSNDKTYNIAAMNGKLANICNDMGKGDVSGGDFKTIVSGECIMARHAYGRPFNADNLPLIIANVNEMPVTTDHTLGHFRRPLPIPFRVTITDEQKDVELESKLLSELSGIFNWIYEGRKRFIRQKGKFTEGDEIKSERSKIRIESNSVLQFLQEMRYSCRDSRGALRMLYTTKEMYARYEQYCRDYGNNNVFKGTSMGRIMASEGYKLVRVGDTRGYEVYCGGEEYTETEEERISRLMEERDLPF